MLLLLPANYFDSGDSICLSVLLLDMECYACGMTRAIMHIIHFDFIIAWEYNSIAFIVFPLLVYVWVDIFSRSLKRLKILKQESLLD